jgi:hypothetical protein
MAGLWRFFSLWEPPRDGVVVSSSNESNEETTMKPISSIIALAGLAASVAACSVQERTYYPRQAYAPATTTYYSTPGGTAVVATTPAPAYYSYDQPSFQKANVYSSQSDYYRNYQGIHGGPERTGW